jgi:two-component system, chemotaxis family, CheB/CheR fusion protein
MVEHKPNRRWWSALPHQRALERYGGAALTTWVALSLWSLSPFLRRDPFALFLAAVVVTARFFGFGPALFCSFLSTACLDFFVLPLRFHFALNTEVDLERLAAFLTIAVLVGSLARLKTKAELKAERTLREKAAIVEYSDDAIFSINPDGVITSWNRGAERLYRYGPDEAVGASVKRLAPPERQAEVEHNLELLRRGGHIDFYRTERMRKGGTRVPVLLSIASLRNTQGAIVGGSMMARDISVQKQSEEAIRRSEKLAAAGRLAASVAHEINNPLEAVLNLLYLARHDPSQADRYLTMAEQEVGRVASLTQQTLGFVRETNVPGPLNPAKILDEVLQLYSRTLEGKKIRVARRYRSGCEIVGYSGELRQLLSNLLVNAVDAMESGGSLQVRVAAGHQWSDGAEGVRITIADNGSGIPRETLGRIFEPFYTTKQERGTGLGLWVCRGIVEKHRGSIRVRSRVDGERSGTVFSVFLPAVRQAVPATEAAFPVS